MHRLILDTSSIVFAASRKVDVLRSVEEQLGATAVISSGVLRELGGLSLGRTKEGRSARVALEMMKGHRVEVVKDDGEVDKWVLRAGSAPGVYVCTNDINLKRALRKKGKRPLSVSENGVLR
jgi:rRNA-processing protein FCF1